MGRYKRISICTLSIAVGMVAEGWVYISQGAPLAARIGLGIVGIKLLGIGAWGLVKPQQLPAVIAWIMTYW